MLRPLISISALIFGATYAQKDFEDHECKYSDCDVGFYCQEVTCDVFGQSICTLGYFDEEWNYFQTECKGDQKSIVVDPSCGLPETCTEPEECSEGIYCQQVKCYDKCDGYTCTMGYFTESWEYI